MGTLRVKRFFLLFAVAFCLLPGHARAFTKTATFQASVTALDACSLSATPMNFGAVTLPASSDVDATSSITVNCTSGTVWSLSLSSGASGNFATRHLLIGTEGFMYNLYTDAGHINIWGDGTNGSITVGGTGTGADQVNTVYGRIFSGQSPLPGAGTYSDTITVTLTY